MRWRLALAAVLVLVAGSAVTRSGLAADPAALDLELVLDAPARHLSASATVTLPPGAEGRLLLDPGFTIEGEGVSRDGPAILVAGNPDARRQVRFRYAGTLPELDGRGTRMGAGPEGGFLPPGAGWYPIPADAPTMHHRVAVRGPAGRRAVASGALLTEETTADGYRAVFESEAPDRGPVLLEGPYEIAERTAHGVRLRTYFPAELAALTETYLDNAAAYIRRFGDAIGPYPYAAFHMVAAPLPVGYGFTNLTYMSSRILPMPFARGRSLAHEVLHNWWGGAVDVDYPSGNWAEGLTTYMADYMLAGPPGSATREEMRLEWLHAYAALPADRERPLTTFVSKQHDAAQVVGYGKAAFVFHMLRRRLGDAGFLDAMQRFWQANRGRAAGWVDLRRAAEDAAGRPLQPFFRQWLDRSGAPVLGLADVAVASDAAGGFVTRFRLTQTDPPYELQVPVTVETAEAVHEEVVALASSAAAVEIATAAQPRRLAVDPAYHVFRRLAPGEVPPIFRDVTLAPRTALVIAGGDADYHETARRLATRLADAAPPTAVAQDASLPDADIPVMVFGPEAALAAWGDAHGLPPAPAAVADVGDARAWTARLPDGRPVLAVAAPDARVLQAISRPFPHYGRRGYVAFAEGRAVAQGVAAPSGGPLTRVFPP